MRTKIGLVYLNRKVEGSLPVKQFIDSYRASSPGIDHELITIYKGFSSGELGRARWKFKNIEHRHAVVDDNMTDIDSYLVAAKSFPDIDVFCFLNTFSQIASKNWLLYLFDAISKDNIGIVGATASYESLLNSLKLIAKVVWLCDAGFLKYDRFLHNQYKTHINQSARWWVIKNIVHWLRLGKIKQISDYSYLTIYNTAFEDYWCRLTAQDGVFAFLNGYPPFPNPNIRTNGFMIRREHLLPFLNRSVQMTKKESYLFESGSDSLTRQIQNKGLRAVIVNSSGEIFDVEDWPKSETFRLGQQKGLLIRDNQTRSFERLNLAEKDALVYMTWGGSLKNSLGPVFTFGIPFGEE